MRRIVFAILLGVLATIPVAGSRIPGTGLRVAFIALVLPAVPAFLYVVRHRRWGFASPALVAAGLFTLSTIASLPAASSAHAIDLTLMTVAGVGCACAIVAVSGPPQIAVILEVFSLVAGVVAGIALSQTGSLTSRLGGSVVSGRLQGLFSQPNELGGFCALALPIAIVTARHAENRLRRVLLLASTAAITVALVLSLSRGAWSGALAALVVLVVLLPDTRRAVTAVVLALVAAVAGATFLPQTNTVPAVLGSRLQSLTGGAGEPYDARPQIWAQAIRLAGQHPWLGVGPGGYQQQSRLPAAGLYANPPEHAHDIFLTVLAEQGIVGALALSAMVLALAVTGVRILMPGRGNPQLILPTARWTATAPLAALAGTAVHGLTDMPLRNPILTVAVWIVFGCAASARFAIHRGAAEPIRERVRKEYQPGPRACPPPEPTGSRRPPRTSRITYLPAARSPDRGAVGCRQRGRSWRVDSGCFWHCACCCRRSSSRFSWTTCPPPIRRPASSRCGPATAPTSLPTNRNSSPASTPCSCHRHPIPTRSPAAM